MPTVPYTGVPEQQPSLDSGARTGAATAEAFGTPQARADQAVGQAVAGVGSEIMKASDVIANHALKMQDDLNVADANDLFIKADVAASERKAEYNKLEGRQASEGYKQYLSDLEKLREDYKKSAPNEKVARSFDQDFKRRFAYLASEAAGRAASETRRYENETGRSRIKLAHQDVAASPLNDFVFGEAEKAVTKEIEAEAQRAGWSEERKQVAMTTETSALWKSKLEGFAKRDPFAAKELFNKNREKLGPLVEQTEESIDNAIVLGGSKIRADELYNKGVVKPRANAAQPNEFWGNPLSPDFVKDKIVEIKTRDGKTVSVHKEAAEDFQAFVQELEDTGYKINSIGGYAKREKQGGPNRKGSGDISQHAYGNAIDINPASNPFDTRLRTNLPENISEIAAKHNLVWGGNWVGDKDSMHFEWAPGKGLSATTSEQKLAKTLESAREEAQKQFPENPAKAAAYEQNIVQGVVTRISRARAASTQYQRDLNVSVLSEVLDPSKKPTDYTQLSPGAQASLEELQKSNPMQAHRIQRLFDTNAKGDVPDTPGRTATYQRLHGLAQLQPDEFERSGWENADVTNAQRNKLFEESVKLKKTTQGKTQLLNALRVLTPELVAAGVYSDKSDKTATEKRSQFEGALDLILRQYLVENKKPMNEADVKKAGAGLLREQVYSKPYNILGFDVPFTGTYKRPYETFSAPIAVQTEEQARALPSGSMFILNGERRIRK